MTTQNKIDVLKRRRAFLTNKLDFSKAPLTDLHYLRAELSALEWAIPVLEGEGHLVSREVASLTKEVERWKKTAKDHQDTLRRLNVW